MQYLLHGQIFEVIPKSFLGKEVGAVSREFVEVTVEQVALDSNGFRVKDVEKVNLSMDDYGELKASIDKYITVPYDYRAWFDKTSKSNKSGMMPSDGLNYIIYDKNPFLNKSTNSNRDIVIKPEPKK